MRFYFSLLTLLATFALSAQGLVSGALNNNNGIDPETGNPIVECGSFKHMQHLETIEPGFIESSNEALEQMAKQTRSAKTANSTVLIVPIVFHVVYNNADENLADSVILSQLDVLNKSFRRLNADTTTMRSDFAGLVGDTYIQFELATADPMGNATSGITRTNTAIEHFGGILPYNQTQTAQIQQWVNDSLFFNLYRLTQDSLGGISAWDTERYFNVWIGDLRIFEPLINNFEELVFFGLASPPATHPNWQGTGFDTLIYEQGALMHYVTVGPNNPNTYPSPYGAFNGSVKEGDLFVHEAGHYLGLRHIWGDGDCTADDFISDTPLAFNSSQFGCNKNSNTCIDSIGGVDLPDMVENFMDYASDACTNSFTKEQASLMYTALQTYRPNLYTSIGLQEHSLRSSLTCFPNPTTGAVTLASTQLDQKLDVSVYTLTGALVSSRTVNSANASQIEIIGPKGVYLIQVSSANEVAVFRVVKN